MLKLVTPERGYSLIELVVVVAIAGVVVTLAIPTFRTTMHHFSVTGTARKLVSDLRLAQGLAVKENTPHQIVFDTAGEDYEIRRCPCTPGTLVQATRDLGEPGDSGLGSIDLISVLNSGSGNETVIRFGRNGMVVEPTADFPITVTLKATATEELMQVAVHRTGKVETIVP